MCFHLRQLFFGRDTSIRNSDNSGGNGKDELMNKTIFSNGKDELVNKIYLQILQAFTSKLFTWFHLHQSVLGSDSAIRNNDIDGRNGKDELMNKTIFSNGKDELVNKIYLQILQGFTSKLFICFHMHKSCLGSDTLVRNSDIDGRNGKDELMNKTIFKCCRVSPQNYLYTSICIRVIFRKGDTLMCRVINKKWRCRS